MSFGPEKYNRETEPNFKAKEFLSSFYRKLYFRDKHDSPDESRTSLVRRIKKIILENKIFPNRVLNIGSGPQALEKQLLDQHQGGEPLREAAEFVSIDLAQIRFSKLLGRKNVQHVQGNADALPFKDQSFGLVVSNHAIDFCPQEEAFQEAYRVLSNGGKGIFYLHHPSMFKEFPENEKVRVFWQYLKDNSILFSKEEDIKTFLEKVGFVTVEISLKSDKMKIDTWWEVVVEKPAV